MTAVPRQARGVDAVAEHARVAGGLHDTVGAAGQLGERRGQVAGLAGVDDVGRTQLMPQLEALGPPGPTAMIRGGRRQPRGHDR